MLPSLCVHSDLPGTMGAAVDPDCLDPRTTTQLLSSMPLFPHL